MNINIKGKFITFEGGEGSGKSTQSKMLYDFLNAKGIRVILTREVGGTLAAENIRAMLLNMQLLPISELMLVMAARYEHVNKLITPALDNGTWVICDRFIDSTAVYQGQCKEIGMDTVYKWHKEIISGMMPDLTFFIDLDPKVALKRAKVRGDNNKFEDRNVAFHQLIYKGFQEVTKKFKDRIVKIPAKDFNKEEVHQQVIANIKRKAARLQYLSHH